MAYTFDPAAPIDVEVRRVVTEQLSEAIARLENLAAADSETIETEVHHVRKRTKEVRAVARMVRKELGGRYARFNALVRDAAAELASIRDAHALLGTFDELIGATGSSASLDRARAGQATISEQATRSVHGGDPRVGTAHDLLVSALHSVERWRIADDFSVLRTGLEDTYRRGRSEWKQSRRDNTDYIVHEWRKSAKHLWYQLRLLKRCAPSVLDPQIAVLDHLGDALGDDHDLAVLVDQMNANPSAFGGKRAVTAAAKAARAEQQILRVPAFRLGATLYAESSEAFVERIARYWDRTARFGAELPVGGIAFLASAESDASDVDDE